MCETLRRGLLIVWFPVCLSSGLCDTATETIVGTWRGTSACVNREAAPACSDEQVVYDITAVAGKENTVAVKADKIIDGKRLPMGVLDFTRNPTDGQWSTEFGSPRLHARWSLSTRGNTMTGTMVLLPSNVVVRKIDLQKAK